jgi:hypothetical protein
VAAVEELAVDGPLAAPGATPPATAGAFGGSTATELRWAGTLALGPEELQPVTSVTARSNATTVTLTAQFGCRHPDIARLWAKGATIPGPSERIRRRAARHARLLRGRTIARQRCTPKDRPV